MEIEDYIKRDVCKYNDNERKSINKTQALNIFEYTSKTIDKRIVGDVMVPYKK